jgi:curved DNA-binding protein CbpA
MYGRLEVPPEASSEQIRSAYRRLAHAVHPDAHPDDPDAARRFREITEAYDTLSSPDRRDRYDRARRDTPATPRQAHVDVPVVLGPRGSRRMVFDGPITLGIDAVPVGSAPLLAGPVRVDPGPGVSLSPPADAIVELARLMEAIWARWGSY